MHLTLDLNFKDFILWTGGIYFGAFACWAAIELLYIIIYLRKENGWIPGLLMLGNILAIIFIPIKGTIVAFKEFVNGDLIPLALLNMADANTSDEEDPPKE